MLAAVTIGVYMGWYTPQLTTVETRLSGNAFWEILVFLVNALLFALIGLQLHLIAGRLAITGSLIGEAALVTAAVIADPDRLGPDLHLRAALPVPKSPRARPVPAVAGARSCSPGPAFAAPSRSPPRSRSRPTFPTAT